MRFPSCSSRLRPRLWLLRATSRRRAQHLCARRHSVADAPLPGGAGQPGAFCQERSCSLGAGERAVPLLQNKTQNMNTNENLISTGCPATAPQPVNQIVKPVKLPAQPQEWKIVSLTGMSHTRTMQHCETPDQAAAYWKTHIANHPYFNPECECWWYSFSTHAGASKVTIWCPLARWIRSFVIPGRFSDCSHGKCSSHHRLPQSCSR